MGVTTMGALIGGAIDAMSGDDDSVADGALYGAITANVLKVVLPLKLDFQFLRVQMVLLVIH